MGKILVQNCRIYAFHGCLPEEAIIGTDYIINLEVSFNATKSMQSDELADTIDYVALNQIIKEEMKIRSKLIEHVANRILNRIEKEISYVTQIKIQVAKINPPIGGDVERVTFEFEKTLN